MNNVKRIFIVADITYSPVKMFLNAMRKLSKGFVRLGHDVEIFSYRKALFYLSPIKSKTFATRFYKSRVDALLAEQIKFYNPDIVWVGFPRVLDNDTIDQMRQAAPNAIFMGGDGDPWPELNKKKMETAKKLDILVATNDGEFLQTYRDAGVPHCAFIPNMCDPDIDYKYEVAPQWETDILWTGKATHGAASNAKFREELVGRLAKQENCTLYGCFGRPKIGGIEYLQAISGAKIGVNVNAYESVKLCHSDRLTHYLSCGTFVLARRFEGCNMLFEDGKHLKYFDTVDEFFELSKWYLEHESERKKIADAGMKWAHEKYNPVEIAKYILDLADKNSGRTTWFY